MAAESGASRGAGRVEAGGVGMGGVGQCAGLAADGPTTRVGDLAWVNLLVLSMWPKASAAIAQLARDGLVARLQDRLPPLLRRLRLARFGLGGGAPELGPVEVTEHPDGHLQLELDLRYASDVDILLEVEGSGISFGVSRLAFDGRLCLAVEQLVPVWPVAGAARAFFAGQPRLELRFAGLAAVADVPGIAEKVRDAIDDLLRSSLVLPNFKSLRLADRGFVDLTAAGSPRPLGVLRVKVLRALRLAGANWKAGSQVERFPCDPYCVLRLGGGTARSSTVRGTVSPEWGAGEPSGFFVVHHLDQELDIDVMGEGSGLLSRSFVGLLGQVRRASARELLGGLASAPGHGQGAGARRRLTLDTSRVNRSMLHVNDPVGAGIPSELELEVEWLPLARGGGAGGPAVPPARQRPHAPAGLLTVELHGGSGFPELAASDPRRSLAWRCRLEHEGGAAPPAACSRRGLLQPAEPEREPLPVDAALAPVIDRLAERHVPVAEIAAIVDASVQAVAQYLERRMARRSRELLERGQRGDGHCVDLSWHETLELLVQSTADAVLMVELVEGGESVVGSLDPMPVHDLVTRGGSLPRTTLQLSPPARQAARAGRVAPGWLCTAQASCQQCSGPDPASSRRRFAGVRMEVSVQYRRLERAAGPGLDSQVPPLWTAAKDAAESPGGASARAAGETAGSHFRAARIGGC